MIFLCNFGFAKNQDYNGEDHVNGRFYHYGILPNILDDNYLNRLTTIRIAGLN